MNFKHIQTILNFTTEQVQPIQIKPLLHILVMVLGKSMTFSLLVNGTNFNADNLKIGWKFSWFSILEELYLGKNILYL